MVNNFKIKLTPICAFIRINIMVLTSLLDSNFSDTVEKCKVAISNFHIKDLVEIIILALMLFLAFHLLKGRKEEMREERKSYVGVAAVCHTEHAGFVHLR